MRRADLWLSCCVLLVCTHAMSGELLYNGIELPDVWPPTSGIVPGEPMPVPYLDNPPEVIPIDLGRQLFVDDFLVGSTDLTRTYHRAEYVDDNPILWPNRATEYEGSKPTSMIFSDGVFYDSSDRTFKMWYLSGYVEHTSYAVSKDGLHWHKPRLDVRPGTNVVVGPEDSRDSNTVWLDHTETDPQQRFKMFSSIASGGRRLAYRVSPDGIHWSEHVSTSPGLGDRTTVFYNPFRDLWVDSIRYGHPTFGRTRKYREHAAAADLSWPPNEPVFWTSADDLDPRNPDPAYNYIDPQLYNLDAVAYESLMVGEFAIWQGDRKSEGRAKRNEVLLGFSRDGFHWYRPDRQPFAGVNESPGAWNWGNVQSAGGGFLVAGDQLYFYLSGRDEDRSNGPTTTGLAVLRRDGFASMDAGPDQGVLTTRPVQFGGSQLFVNVGADGGELLVEVLDQDDQVIAPFSRDNCQPLGVDKTIAAVRWNGAEDLSGIAGQPVKFRFYLTDGSLYSFWVSPDQTGASNGYLAGGGPGYLGAADTTGIAAGAVQTVVKLPTADTIIEGRSDLQHNQNGETGFGLIGRNAAGDDINRGLLKFDLSDLSTQNKTAVSNATLILRAVGIDTNGDGFFDTDGNRFFNEKDLTLLQMSPANTDWVESEVSWAEMRNGVGWDQGSHYADVIPLGSVIWNDGDLEFTILKSTINSWIRDLGGNVSLLLCSESAEAGTGVASRVWGLRENAFDEPWLVFDVAYIPEPIPGDANWDGRVNDADAAILASHWQMVSDATWSDGDFNGDRKVNDLDASILATNWQETAEGRTPPVPEPSSMILVAAALLWWLGAGICPRKRGHDTRLSANG